LVAIWDRVPPLSETIEKVDAVSREDVTSFAEQLVAGSGAALALYGPADKAPTLEQLQARMAA
jgi:predicted Zn-dependent peptidase